MLPGDCLSTIPLYACNGRSSTISLQQIDALMLCNSARYLQGKSVFYVVNRRRKGQHPKRLQVADAFSEMMKKDRIGQESLTQFDDGFVTTKRT